MVTHLKVLLFIMILCAGFETTISDQVVRLASTLIFTEFAYPGNEVIFSCVAKGSASVIWLSDEYIGDIEGNENNLTSGDVGIPKRINSYTKAVLVSANISNGTEILVSELKINVSSEYPNPSVTCRVSVDGLSNETISFKVLTGNVNLTSSVKPGSIVYPEQAPKFTCMVRDSSFLEWRYNNQEDHVALTKDDQLGIPIIHEHFDVTLVNWTRTATGKTVLLSILRLKGVIDSETTITCLSGDHRENTSITVYKNNRPSVQLNTLSNSTCIEGSLYWHFECLAGGTSYMQWRGNIPGNVINISCSNSPSDNYAKEPGIRIQTSLTDAGCMCTLSLSTEFLPVNLTCQNIQLGTEDSRSFTALEGKDQCPMILDSVQDSPPVIFVSGALRVTARLSYGWLVIFCLGVSFCTQSRAH